MARVAFRRLGRAWHPVVDTVADLSAAMALDDALWATTAAPTAAFQADPVLLAALDPDGDGRVHADDVRAAVRWTLDRLADPRGVTDRSAVLRLAELSPLGEPLAVTARELLRLRGGPAGDAVVTLEAVRAARLDEEQRALGGPTAAAREATAAVKDKIDQYFLLCETVRYDPAFEDRARPDPARLDLLDPATLAAGLARAPLARPRPDGILDLDGYLNPSFIGAVDRFRRDAVRPALGDRGELDRAAWAELQGAIAQEPATGWLAALRDLERLLVCRASLLDFANSFVAQRDLHRRGARALFEVGELVLDGRRFRFAVRVLDRVRAEKFAVASGIFVMFVQVGAVAGTWDYEVAVPVTDGHRGNLVEGAWGVFLDRDGLEHHAQVRIIVENPIGFWQALLAPLGRLARALVRLVDTVTTPQFAAPSNAPQLDAVAAAGPPRLPPAPRPVAVVAAPTSAVLVAVVAAGGLALAAVGSALAYVSAFFVAAVDTVSTVLLRVPGLSSLPALAVVLAAAFVGLCFLAVPCLAYLVPSMVNALVRLRRRDLATLLEGSGFAMNARIGVVAPLAQELTERPAPDR